MNSVTNSDNDLCDEVWQQTLWWMISHHERTRREALSYLIRHLITNKPCGVIDQQIVGLAHLISCPVHCSLHGVIVCNLRGKISYLRATRGCGQTYSWVVLYLQRCLSSLQSQLTFSILQLPSLELLLEQLYYLSLVLFWPVWFPCISAAALGSVLELPCVPALLARRKQWIKNYL